MMLLLQLVYGLLILETCLTDEPSCPKVDCRYNSLDKQLSLESELKATSKKLANLEQKLADEVKERSRLQQTFESQLQTFRQTSDAGILQPNNKILEFETPSKVSPVYFLVTDVRAELLNKRPIFSTIVNNEGGAYDAHTGAFVCKSPGIYHFSFTFASQSNNAPWCWLLVNNQNFVFASAKGHYDSGTIVVNKYLNTGEKIHVECEHWDRIYVKKGGVWFSGVLIRQ